jgi:hypothetical protein
MQLSTKLTSKFFFFFDITQPSQSDKNFLIMLPSKTQYPAQMINFSPLLHAPNSPLPHHAKFFTSQRLTFFPSLPLLEGRAGNTFEPSEQ